MGIWCPHSVHSTILQYLVVFRTLTFINVSLMPIWITEIGTNDMNYQGLFPLQAFDAINEQVPQIVPVVLWFCWSDGMVTPFGVTDINFQNKESYYSFQQFAQLPQVKNKCIN